MKTHSGALTPVSAPKSSMNPSAVAGEPHESGATRRITRDQRRTVRAAPRRATGCGARSDSAHR